MTELDLGLKVGIRRVLWQMGFSTRLDVEMRGSRTSSAREPEGNRRRGGAESFTDLDVIGVRVTPSFRVQTTIADCKTGRRDRPTARMFWARGVADLFAADEVMLVREHDVNDAARQLSHRLGVTVVAASDLQALQRLHGIDQVAPGGVIDVLFDRAAVADNLAAFTGLDRRLHDLLEYRDFDYWVYDPYRNLTQLVAHLRAAADHLHPRNPVHLALLVDFVWLYTLSTTRAAARVRAAHLRDLDRGLQEYLFGGPVNLQEKRDLVAALRELAPDGQAVSTPLPPYYNALRELVGRQLRRPDRLQAALRHAEVASAVLAARRRVALPEALGREYDPIAAKLAADVSGFLVGAAGLQTEFRAQLRAILLAEAMPAVPRGTRASEEEKPPTAADLTAEPPSPTGTSAGQNSEETPRRADELELDLPSDTGHPTTASS